MFVFTMILYINSSESELKTGFMAVVCKFYLLCTLTHTILVATFCVNLT